MKKWKIQNYSAKPQKFLVSERNSVLRNIKKIIFQNLLALMCLEYEPYRQKVERESRQMPSR